MRASPAEEEEEEEEEEEDIPDSDFAVLDIQFSLEVSTPNSNFSDIDAYLDTGDPDRDYIQIVDTARNLRIFYFSLMYGSDNHPMYLIPHFAIDLTYTTVQFNFTIIGSHPDKPNRTYRADYIYSTTDYSPKPFNTPIDIPYSFGHEGSQCTFTKLINYNNENEFDYYNFDITMEQSSI